MAQQSAMRRGVLLPVLCLIQHGPARGFSSTVGTATPSSLLLPLPQIYQSTLERRTKLTGCALRCSSTGNDMEHPAFKKNDKIQVEVVRFGHLGASVDVIGIGHREDDCIGEDEPVLGSGLVLQKEIAYFRDSRGGLDVVAGEVLSAYVEDNSRDDGKLNVSLRPPGGKTKTEGLANIIIDKLEWSEDGTLPVGDKSTPAEIAAEFPGISKGVFKKAVSALYKRGKVKPASYSISLISDKGVI